MSTPVTSGSDRGGDTPAVVASFDDLLIAMKELSRNRLIEVVNRGEIAVVADASNGRCAGRDARPMSVAMEKSPLVAR